MLKDDEFLSKFIFFELNPSREMNDDFISHDSVLLTKCNLFALCKSHKIDNCRSFFDGIEFHEPYVAFFYIICYPLELVINSSGLLLISAKYWVSYKTENYTF